MSQTHVHSQPPKLSHCRWAACAVFCGAQGTCLWLRCAFLVHVEPPLLSPPSTFLHPVNPAQNAVFCVASQVNNTVTSINIAENDIKAEGAKAFAEMLKVCLVCFSLVAGVVVGLPVDWLRVFLDVCTL